MPGQDANISRNMYDERKRYIRGIVQQQIPWVDADENDSTESLITYNRRITQSVYDDGYINDGFKIRECDDSGVRYNGNVNNFIVVGQALSDSPREIVSDGKDGGAYFTDGLRCVLFSDVIYDADDPIPDQSGDPDPISQASIFPRVTDIEYIGGNTVITDSAQDYVTNELAGRTISFLNGGALSPYTIASNTTNTITISGTDLTSSVYVYDRYRVNLTTPSGSNRTDAVYLNVYIDQINAAEDPDLYHALDTPTEAQIREQVIQEILVREDVTTHGELTSYEDSDGNQHYVTKVATIERLDGDNTITDAMITDNTIAFGSSLLSSPFETYGSSKWANHSTGGVDNMPVDGSWPNAPSSVPDGGYWIAREEDDNGNDEGYYFNNAGTWTWAFPVTTHSADDVAYDNTSSGLAATEVQSAIDEVIANAGISYYMRPGDGTTEFSSHISDIVSAGEGKITFAPGSYTINVPASATGWDLSSASLTLEGFGIENTLVQFVRGVAGQNAFDVEHLEVKNMNLGDMSTDWTTGDTLFKCGTKSRFDNVQLTSGSSSGKLTLIDAGDGSILTRMDIWDNDCVVDLGIRCIISDSRKVRGDISMGVSGLIQNVYQIGTTTQGNYSKIDTVQVTSGTITQGIDSSVSNLRSGAAIVQSDNSSISNCESIGDVTQGDDCRVSNCGQVGDITQGTNSIIANIKIVEVVAQDAHSKVDGITESFTSITQSNGYGIICNSTATATDNISQSGGYCTITGCSLVYPATKYIYQAGGNSVIDGNTFEFARTGNLQYCFNLNGEDNIFTNNYVDVAHSGTWSDFDRYVVRMPSSGKVSGNRINISLSTVTGSSRYLYAIFGPETVSDNHIYVSASSDPASAIVTAIGYPNAKVINGNHIEANQSRDTLALRIYSNEADCVISGNQLNHVATGATTSIQCDGNRANISGNTINGSGNELISALDSSQCVISNNRVTGNILAGGSCTVTGNSAANIELNGGSSYYVINSNRCGSIDGNRDSSTNSQYGIVSANLYDGTISGFSNTTTTGDNRNF